MGTVTDLYTLPSPHRKAIIEKADRCVPLIEEWAGNLLALSNQGEGVELANYPDALGHILDVLRGTGQLAEMYWSKLGELHHVRYPDHPGKAEFDTSRPIILAKIEAKVWSANRAQAQPEADPFDRLTF